MSDDGLLSVCATPIGNLEDITLRVLRTLREADFIAAEDTRHTLKLLSRYEIKKPLLSYHAHNEKQRAQEIIGRLQDGQHAALVSDAGLPGISDPGAVLIQECRAAGIRVDVLPGASAGVTALVLSGLPAEKFLFLGFLPATRGARLRELEAAGELPYTLVFYEAPHRLTALLGEMAAMWPTRAAAVTRELTKLHQTVHAGTLAELAAQFAGTPPKGECVLLLAPYEPPPMVSTPPDWLRSLEELTGQGMLPKEGIKQVAAHYGVSKNAVAQEWQRRQKKEDG